MRARSLRGQHLGRGGHRIADLHVKQQRGDRQAHAQDARDAPAHPGARGEPGARCRLRCFLQHLPLQFVDGLCAVLRAQRLGLKILLDPGQLIGMQPARDLGPRQRTPGAGHDQWRNDEQQRQHQQRDDGQPQDRHGASPSRSETARSRSAGVSGSGSERPCRDTIRHIAAKPATSSTKGPSHNSQVDAMNGGS